MTVVANSGKYKKPIMFRKKKLSGDGGGGRTKTWEDYAPGRVRILPVSAAQRIRGEQVEAQVTHLLEGRYRNDVDGDMQILFSDRILKIEWIINVEEENILHQYGCTEL
jgi:SPP1 family predicted phage head-tail adaptor